MAIENPDERNPKQQPEIVFVGEAPTIKTAHVDWNTKTAYDITIRTYDPNVLALGTLRADSHITVKVAPKNATRRANTRKEAK